MTNILVSCKDRIKEYIDYKGIKKTEFYKQTTIKRGFLDTDKMKSDVSDSFLKLIIRTYDDINLYWLVTGEGNMIKNNEDFSSKETYLEKLVNLLEQENKRLQKENENLKNQYKKPLEYSRD